MSGIAPHGADSQAQFLLGFDGQAQFNISGKLEPLTARVSEVDLKEKKEQKECLNQLDLLIKANQIDLPLPNSVHGEEECKRGYIAHICKNHGTETKDAEIVPVYCGKLNCVDSTVSLSKRRARNAIHGTKIVNGEKIGLDKLISNFSLGYFVYTLPEHLRRLLYDLSFLNKWHKACLAFTKEILIANGAREDALFAYKTYFHGNGDIDPSQYKPHLNILVPLVYWSESKGKAYRTSSYFPSDFFDSDRWRNRYRELVEKELGFDLFDIAGKKESQLNFYYQPRITLEEKLHCVKYNSRVLPNFSRINKGKVFYPRSSGLLSQKRSELLASILSTLKSAITVNCPKHKRGEVNCSFTAISAASEAALDLALLQYFNCRQSMAHGSGKIAKSTADPPSPKAILPTL